jgi:hypothetical protein
MLQLKKIMTSLFLIAPICLMAAPNLKHEKMKSHLDIIKNILEVGYAPAKWKESHFGWSLDEEINKAKNKIDIAGELTTKDFQKIVRDFFMSMHDLHVSVRFHSTEYAALPFLVKGAGDRYFITNVKQDKLSPAIYHIEVGDEIVMFDGMPTHEAVLALQKETMCSTEEGTDRTLTELTLTNRSGAEGHNVPNGPIMIGTKKLYSEKIQYTQLTWDYEPELVSNRYKIPLDFDEQKPIFEQEIFKPLMISGCDEFFKEIFKDDVNCGQRIGGRRSFLPSLGKKWWTAGRKKEFHAYLYENEERNLIGYIRIPHFMGSMDDVYDFAEIINFFEDRSDALIIDQVNNPGGSLFYMSALAGMLTDQPLHTPKHHVAINQDHVMQAAYLIPLFEDVMDDEDARSALGSSFYGIPVTHQMSKFFLNYFRFILSEWEAGHTLTSATHLYGFDKINPNPLANYSKPILILVNELSISCGDFFPAIMQDNNRAIIMGTKTSGAGGFVLPAHFPNILGLSHFRYTGSIAERLDKNPIENLGVTPDVPYKITDEDLQHSYRDYVNAVNKAISIIIKCEKE